MTLVTQTDFRLDEPIRRWGCNKRAIEGGVELLVGKALTPEQIVSIYNKFRGKMTESGENYKEILSKECSVGAPRFLINETLRLLGYGSWYGYQIGAKDKEGNKTFWGWVKDKEVTYSVIRWKSVREEHFTLGDEDGEEVWDPYPCSQKKERLQTIFYQVKRS